LLTKQKERSPWHKPRKANPPTLNKHDYDNEQCV